MNLPRTFPGARHGYLPVKGGYQTCVLRVDGGFWYDAVRGLEPYGLEAKLTCLASGPRLKYGAK